MRRNPDFNAVHAIALCLIFILLLPSRAFSEPSHAGAISQGSRPAAPGDGASGLEVIRKKREEIDEELRNLAVLEKSLKSAKRTRRNGWLVAIPMAAAAVGITLYFGRMGKAMDAAVKAGSNEAAFAIEKKMIAAMLGSVGLASGSSMTVLLTRGQVEALMGRVSAAKEKLVKDREELAAFERRLAEKFAHQP